MRSDLCDYSDAYIVVKGKITVTNPNNNACDKKVALRNNAPFLSCISEINKTLIDNAEDLDIVMPMYNLIEYNKNYKKATGSLFNYDRYEPSSGTEGNINYSIKNSKSFDYKTSITGKLEGSNVDKDDVEIVVPSKYLSNFWRTLDIPFINCEVSLRLTWSENCAIKSKTTREADPDADPTVAGINKPTNSIFKIKDTKLYVPVVTLLAEDDNKRLEQLKTGFKRTAKWNKYVNLLIVLSFENEGDRTSFSKSYVAKVETKDFNALIDGKPFFEIPVKNKEEAYEAIIEMSKNNDYTTGNLLDYEYFKDHYKLIAIDLSKQIELENPDSTIKFGTKVIKPNLCDYSDACIFVTGDTKIGDVAGNANIAFKNVLLLQDV